MKFVILLCALSALLLQTTLASPVNVAERQARAVARQQATGVNDVAPVAIQAEDEDDEDDDDDDDPDLGDLVDDDDDDDEDEEDDDDEEEDDTPQGQAAPAPGAAAAADDDEEDDDDDDYLDRLFDDILGDDDEEDDDEDVSPAASVQNTIASQPAAPIEDIEPAVQSAVSTGISDGVDLPAESSNLVDPAPAGNAADDLANTAGTSNNNNNEGGLKNNVIDMSSDAFQERHNQFIDSIFSRINRIVADNYDPFIVRLNTRPAVKEAEQQETPTKNLSSAKVKSNTSKSNTLSTTVSTKKLKNTKSEPRALVAGKLDSTFASTDALAKGVGVGDSDGDGNGEAVAKAQTKLQQQLQQLQNLKTIEQNNPSKTVDAVDNIDGIDAIDGIEKKSESSDSAAVNNDAKSTEEQSTRPEVRTVFTNENVAKSGNQQKKASIKAHKQNTKSKATATNFGGQVMNASVKNNNNQNNQNNKSNNNKYHQQKVKQSNNNKQNNNINAIKNIGKEVEKLQKAEGSLSGLASLKRVGNVKVIADPEGRNSTIKAKFTLGPLMLRVEKSFKRGSVRSVKSATARTNEMIGRIKFSVVDDRAMLMSIKVQQPKQVEVESKDNHDRTREFIWRRTPKIAKLVNEKLKLAAESLFTPKGVEVVRL